MARFFFYLAAGFNTGGRFRRCWTVDNGRISLLVSSSLLLLLLLWLIIFVLVLVVFVVLAVAVLCGGFAFCSGSTVVGCVGASGVCGVRSVSGVGGLGSSSSVEEDLVVVTAGPAVLL